MIQDMALKRSIICLMLMILLAGCNLNTPTEEASLEPLAPTNEAGATLAPILTNTPAVAPTRTPNLTLPFTATPGNAPQAAATTNSSGNPGIQLINTEALPTVDTTIPFPTTYPFTYPASVRAGQTLLINYTATIFNPGVGRVFIVVRDPTGQVIFRLIVEASAQTTAEVPITTTGEHQILAATSQGYSGDFALTYTTR